MKNKEKIEIIDMALEVYPCNAEVLISNNGSPEVTLKLYPSETENIPDIILRFIEKIGIKIIKE